MAEKYPGLLISDENQHQAFYRGLLDAGANMGGASRLPSSFLQRFSKGAKAFGEGQQGALNQTRQDQLANMQAQQQQQQLAAQEAKIEQAREQQARDALMRANVSKYQADPTSENLRGAYPDRFAQQEIKALTPQPTSTPANIAEWNAYQAMTPKQQEQYLVMKRSHPYLNLGGTQVQPSPTQPGVARGSFDVTPKPEQMPEFKGEQAAATKAGTIRGETSQQAQIDYPKLEAGANEMLGLLDKVLEHPGLEGVVGVPTPSGALGIPGTDEADFDVLLKQVVGKQFMEAYQSLKGGGVITEIEGQKATDAMARMNTAQTEKAFKEAVNEFKKVIERGVIRAQERAMIGDSRSPDVKSNLKSKYGLE